LIIGGLGYFPVSNYAEERGFQRRAEIIYEERCTPPTGSTLSRLDQEECSFYQRRSSRRYSFDFFGYLPIAIVGATFIAGLSLMWVARQRLRSAREGLGRVRQKSEELKQEVRYITTTKEASELGAEGGRGGLVARIKRSQEREMAERPATLSSLIHGFRAFVADITEVLDGPVVIGIDELDKMTDPERVAALRRDIKGIFEIDGAFFLVSISDEAARSLGLGALRTRNEFNSSFYTVLQLEPLDPSQSYQLLEKRTKDFSPSIAYFIGIMSGGVSREVVRIAELVYSSSPNKSFEILETAFVIMNEELNVFLNNIMSATAPNSKLQQEVENDKALVYHNLPENVVLDRNAFYHFSIRALRYWRLDGTSEYWDEHFAEEWRRILIRFSVCSLIIREPGALENLGRSHRLQQIIQTASVSAIVARSQLLNYIRPGIAEASAKLNDNKIELLIELLVEQKHLASIREYATKQGVDFRTARRDMHTLCQMGLLERRGGGRSSSWHLPSYEVISAS
jgi:predicted transcriptional regulator